MHTFKDYTHERKRLHAMCNEVEEIWHEILRSRTALEDLAASAPAPTSDSAVMVALADARKRLSSSTIEIGVFGNVKRGKSTLMNALVGEVVSSMRVTPETAVPVWIESGPRRSIVVFGDGTVEEISDREAAAEMASQRRRAAHSDRTVLRVIQQLPICWLPEGLRLVDTPGLDDPSNIDAYEELTLAELDRVGAAIFVFVSPPGPAGEEIRLLETLSLRGVDKVFLVCNFYPDHWVSAETRAEVVGYIEKIVVGGAADGVAAEDVRVYEVSAKAGLAAVQSGDTDAFTNSGIALLRADLEKFLSNDALPRTLSAVGRRIQTAIDLVADSLHAREHILVQPQDVIRVRDDQRRRVKESQNVLERLFAEIARESKSLSDELVSIMKEPYRETSGTVEAANKIEQVSQAEHRMRLLIETAVSRSSVRFSQGRALLEERVRRELFESFGVADRLSTAGRADLDWSRLAVNEGLTTYTADRTDWSTVGTSAAITAVGGGLVGASLLGGAGIALLAAGPVGWLIGLAVGAAIGGLAGGAGGAVVGRGNLSDQDRSKVLAAIARQGAHAEMLVNDATNDWAAELRRTIQAEKVRFFGDQEAELNRIETVLRDDGSRQAAIRETAALLERLKAVR